MSYAEIDLAIVPEAPPAWKNSRATSWPAPSSANVPYFGTSRLMVSAFWLVVSRSLCSVMGRDIGRGRTGLQPVPVQLPDAGSLLLVAGGKQGNSLPPMKNFITSMLGALVTLVIFGTGAVLLLIGFIGAIIAMGQQKK